MIIFIYGQDTFASQKKLLEIKNKFIEKNGVDSIKTIDGAKTNLREIDQSFGSSSLFAKKRLVIIKNISMNTDKSLFEKLKDYLETKKVEDKELSKNENLLVFIDDDSGKKMKRNILWQFLLKQPFVQNFPLLNNRETVLWIKKRAKELGAVFNFSQIARIAGSFTGDLWQIDNELKKIVNYKRGLQNTKAKQTALVIEDQDLDNMSRGKIDENIFALTDAIGTKNKKLAFVLLEKEIEAGMAESYLLYMIVRQFKIFLQIKQCLLSGLTKKQIVKELKLHPYALEKSLKQVNNFSLNFLENIFLSLVNLDRDLKTGQAKFKISLALLIARL